MRLLMFGTAAGRRLGALRDGGAEVVTWPLRARPRRAPPPADLWPLIDEATRPCGAWPAAARGRTVRPRRGALAGWSAAPARPPRGTSSIGRHYGESTRRESRGRCADEEPGPSDGVHKAITSIAGPTTSSDCDRCESRIRLVVELRGHRVRVNIRREDA